MAEQLKMYWLHALTPLHIGAGFGVRFIDLPIEREKATGWPVTPGSAVKGVLADRAGAAKQESRKDSAKLKAAFGTAGEDHSNSGALVFTDARLVSIPVRSDYGTFAWVTSRRALLRLLRDLKSVGLGTDLTTDFGAEKEDDVLVPDSPRTELHSADPRIYIADLDFAAKTSPAVRLWAEKLAGWLFAEPSWQSEFRKRFAVVPNGAFDMLAETATEVAARVRIDPDRKSVEKGGLWYEESLPAESILAGLVWCDRVFTADGISPDTLMKEFCSGEKTVQIGGKATTGKWRVRCIFGGAHA